MHRNSNSHLVVCRAMINEEAGKTRTKIHAIPVDVCRKICTGQVVITLSGACKELIDNSLDAGAKTIGLFNAVSHNDDTLNPMWSATSVTSPIFRWGAATD